MQYVNSHHSALWSHTIVVIFLIAACSFLIGCSTEKKRLAEAPPPPSVTPADQPQPVAKLPPPQINEVQDAVKRVFKDAVVIHDGHAPAFVAGDFNGDLSEDIAVALKPAPDKLPDLNDEFPTWILRDPFGHSASQAPRLRIAANDVLLAIIHGYGADGWRNPEATQAFLLKNAAGSGLEAHPLKEFTAESHGRSLPSLRGDVIGETIADKPGYLYFAGASYAWYNPKTYKPESEPATAVHGRPAKTIKN